MKFPIHIKEATYPEMRGLEEVLDLSGITQDPIGLSIVWNEKHIVWHTFGET